MTDNKKPQGKTYVARNMKKESVVLDKEGNEVKRETLAEALASGKKITDR